MQSQTHPPALWIVVDDGSADETGVILDTWAERLPWLRVVHRQDRGFRAAGSGVMEAFYAGYHAIDMEDWDFIVKLDGDLTFAHDYFEGCLGEFRRDPFLGIGGGVIYNRIADRLVLERHPRFHVRGATKIYRRALWEQMGGLIREPGWDTIDEVKANQLGWSTRSFHELHLTQERFTGNAEGQWRNWLKNGRGSYICGYHPAFLLAKAFARGAVKPHITATLGLILGYFWSALRRVQRVEDKDLIAFLRREQLRRLFGRTSVWR